MTHKNAEILKAIADGLPLDKVQVKDPFTEFGDVWVTLLDMRSTQVNSYLAMLTYGNDEVEFRIKPEPKPDLTCFHYIHANCFYENILKHDANVEAIYDAETGDLKEIKMLKSSTAN